MSKAFVGMDDMPMPVSALKIVPLDTATFLEMAGLSQIGSMIINMPVGWQLRRHTDNLWVATWGDVGVTGETPQKALGGLWHVYSSVNRDDKNSRNQG